ncbi:MAG: hypothetical protein AMXMBFR64_58100 [Myxococcales bacterium]
MIPMALGMVSLPACGGAGGPHGAGGAKDRQTLSNPSTRVATIAAITGGVKAEAGAMLEVVRIQALQNVTERVECPIRPL